MCDICSNLTVKIPERRSSDSLLLILNRFHTLLWCLYCLRMQMPSLFLAWSFSSLTQRLRYETIKLNTAKLFAKSTVKTPPINSWSFINSLTPITWRWSVFGFQKLHTVKNAPFSLNSTRRLKNFYSVKKAGVVVSGIWLNAQKLFSFTVTKAEVFPGKGALKICGKFTGEYCKFAAYFPNKAG